MKKQIVLVLAVVSLIVGSVCAEEIEWILIEKGQPNLQTEAGIVNDEYRIMKYEVTIATYCDFLNAVAKIDIHNLYDKRMRIVRDGFTTRFTYKPKKGYNNHPVTYINFFRAARFTNWLHNGNPDGKQIKGVTEDGAYDMTGYMSTHSAAAKFWIPSVEEWNKAAYYDPQASKKRKKHFYWDFGDKSNYKESSYPKAELPPGTSHSANYNKKLEDTTPVGAYKSAVSAYGLFDINGNVFEWTETDRTSGMKIIRGGAWNYGGSYILRTHITGARLKEATAGYGFRVVAAPLKNMKRK